MHRAREHGRADADGGAHVQHARTVGQAFPETVALSSADVPHAAADPGPVGRAHVAAHAAPFASTDGAGRGLRLLRRGERLAGHLLDRRGARAAARGQAHRGGFGRGLRTVPRVRIRYERCPEGRRGPLLRRALHERQRDEHAVLPETPARLGRAHRRGGRRRAGRRREDAGGLNTARGRARAALGRPHDFLCVGDARAGRPPQERPRGAGPLDARRHQSGKAVADGRGRGGVEPDLREPLRGRRTHRRRRNEVRGRPGRRAPRHAGPGAARRGRLCLARVPGHGPGRVQRGDAAHLGVGGAGGRGGGARGRGGGGRDRFVQRDGRNGSEATGRDAGGVRGRNRWWGWRAPRGSCREHAGPAKGRRRRAHGK